MKNTNNSCQMVARRTWRMAEHGTPDTDGVPMPPESIRPRSRAVSTRRGVPPLTQVTSQRAMFSARLMT